MRIPARRVRVVVSVLVALLAPLLAAACAHRPDTSAAAPRGRVDPPTMQRGAAPEVRGEVTASYEVMVDATGRADVSTLRLSGTLSSSDRVAVERWIADARFTPARLNGHPVAGLYKGGFKTRVTRVRR
jgi:hypothetical protein